MRKNALLGVATLALLSLTSQANAALVVTNTTDATTLTNTLLAASSGLTIDGSSINVVGGATQQGTYAGFNLGPTTAGEPNITIADGVVLTSGGGNFSTTQNTSNSFSANPGTGSDADMAAILSAAGLNSTTNDKNIIEFNFTVDDPASFNAVSAQFVFATDEFPTQSVTDGMGVFIDGINYAFFPDGTLVSNQPGVNTGFFNNNPVGTDATNGGYGIEWNGLSSVLTVTGLLDAAVAIHTFKLVIVDTSDTIYDSAVFFAGLKAGFTTGGGGIGDPDPIPLPAALPLMLAGLGGLGFMSRRRKTA